MLAHFECDTRVEWLEAALADRDRGVRETALIVLAWIAEGRAPSWPTREDVSASAAADRDHSAPENDVQLPGALVGRARWEYVVEVWRGDGRPFGVYLATTWADDDAHAQCIALGQAILESSRPCGEPFDPSSAAAFVVGKQLVAMDYGV